jgi:NADH:ubiquinone oxidoreductase subunit 6 (subunit J)
MFLDLSFLLTLFIFFNFIVKTNLTKNSVLVALYIVGAFIVSGIIFLLVDISLLGVILIIVYVGAVVVLFLFVTMIIPLRVTVSSYYTFSLFLVYSL